MSHTVQEGQTLWKVAEQYGITVQKLALLNSIQPNATLEVGQVLQVPATAQTVAQVGTAGVKQLPSLKPIPVVTAPVAIAATATPAVQSAPAQPESTLAGLKQNRDRLKQSLAELKSEEKVSRAIPAAEAQPKVETPTLVGYQVRPGETLSSIAQERGISASSLAQLNQITDVNQLTASQTIKVPQAPQQIAAVPQAQPSVQPAVEVPVVPSLAATQTPAVPLAIGGSAEQIAFVKPEAPGRSADVVSMRQPSNGQYINNLVSEIARLREQMRSRGGAERPSVAASPAAAAASQRVSPAFAAARQNQSIRPDAQALRSSLRTPQPGNRLVATANVGSEAHSPLLRPSTGKTVSPNLPGLDKPDAYLPGSGGRLNGYIWPAKGQLTSGYGWRWGRMHRGIDIAAPVGTPIVAAAAGRVITAGWNDGGYGYLVEVEHSDGSVTLYGHNSRIHVRVGQQVRQGQQVADMGSTGFSTGPHSHFEVHMPGQGAVNPMAYLPRSRG
jgi:murein DD-endopeptidase MepM/ murein hydrolase activator NlpD